MYADYELLWVRQGGKDRDNFHWDSCRPDKGGNKRGWDDEDDQGKGKGGIIIQRFVCKTVNQYRIRYLFIYQKGCGFHKCEVCGKDFNHYRYLTDHHRAAHTDDVSSSVCGKTFQNEAKLKRHAVAHNKEKLYTCSSCFKTFGRKDNMKRHEKSCQL